MIRVGRISYLNMAPVFYELRANVEEVTGVPTELNRALLEGEVDIAPISSIEWARQCRPARDAAAASASRRRGRSAPSS